MYWIIGLSMLMCSETLQIRQIRFLPELCPEFH